MPTPIFRQKKIERRVEFDEVLCDREPIRVVKVNTKMAIDRIPMWEEGI